MEDRFKHIDTENEKVHKIINCAFEEFSTNDFKKASTNNIVKKAGISRGLLYHYFKDKQDLYDFLIYYSIKLSIENLEKKIDWDESDFLNRMRQVLESQIEIISRYPYMTEFYQQIREDKIVREYRQKMEEYYPGMRNRFYSYNIDFSKVKEGVDIKKMVNVIRYTFKQIGKELLQAMEADHTTFDTEKFRASYKEYFDFFRKNFYKEDK